MGVGRAFRWPSRAATNLDIVAAIDMVRQGGRILQRVALVVPPLSIIWQLTETITLGQMLMMLVASVAAFYLGRLIEGYSPP